MTVESVLKPVAYLGPLGNHPLLTGVILVAVAVGLNRLLSPSPSVFPRSLPRIREAQGSERFRWKTRLAFYRECADVFQEAYERYSDKGKSVLIPGPGLREELILPPNAIRWLMTQPDTVLSVHDARVDYEKVGYSLGDDKYLKDGWQGTVVRKELIPALDRLSGQLWEELGAAMDSHFGTDSKWGTVDLHDKVRRVLAQVCGRYTVGLPLCRSKSYIDTCLAVMDGCAFTAGLLNNFPDMMQPPIGLLLRFSVNKSIKAMKSDLAPLFDERLRLIQAREKKSDDESDESEEPLDLLDMLMRYAAKERPQDLNLDNITRRLAMCNLEALFQTSFAVTNLILNIIASNPEHGTIAGLKEELAQARAAAGPGAKFWTRAAAASLVRAGSISRETLRLQSFTTRAMARKVVADGVKTEDGVQLPKGCIISILSHSVHTSDDVFEQAATFDPFRYCRPSADGLQPGGAGNLSVITTGPQFLPFSHGRTACPGRFLVDLELKMVIAYLLENYEIRFPQEYHGKRPENRWLGEVIIPCPEAKIELRRRKGGQEWWVKR